MLTALIIFGLVAAITSFIIASAIGALLVYELIQERKRHG